MRSTTDTDGLRRSGRRKAATWRGAGVALAGSLIAAAWYVLTPPTYAVEPGPHAGDARCAKVLADVPQSLLGEPRDRVSGQAVAAWGDAAVVLRCGVTPPQPTGNLCVDVDGVDWVLDEARAARDGVKVLRTYGRTPVVEVVVDDGWGTPGDVLVVLDRAVVALPQAAECVDVGDV